MDRLNHRLGLLSALPLAAVLALSFLAPLLVIAGFSIMPQKVFSLANVPDFSAYLTVVTHGYWKSLAWSLGMAVVSTLLLFLICWPLSFAMVSIARATVYCHSQTFLFFGAKPMSSWKM